MEQAKGHTGNNIITVLREARGIDLQTASDFVGERFESLMTTFSEGKKHLPSLGLALDCGVVAYVKAMEHWVIGNLEWSFETQRYFGPAHAEIRQTRVVALRPAEDDLDDDE